MNKLICKVKPDHNTCCSCIDDQESGIKPIMDCNECISRIPDYEILQVGHSFLTGDWAIVIGKNERKLERVPISRIVIE